ncbi:unnamed protein product [Arctogadus glacialis]
MPKTALPFPVNMSESDEERHRLLMSSRACSNFRLHGGLLYVVHMFTANGFNRLLHGSMGDVKQLHPINVLRDFSLSTSGLTLIDTLGSPAESRWMMFSAVTTSP